MKNVFHYIASTSKLTKLDYPMNIEANIGIERRNGILASINVVCPTWTQTNEDGTIELVVPVFGLKTQIANESEQEIETALQEAVSVFCQAAEKFGRGLEKELTVLGWKLAQPHDNIIEFNLQPKEPVWAQMMQTGHQAALSLAL